MTLRGEICVQMRGEIRVQMGGEIQRRMRTNTRTHGVLALISGTGPLSHLKYTAPGEAPKLCNLMLTKSEKKAVTLMLCQYVYIGVF